MTPLVEERIDEIERLCREHDVARLELFGSAASGEFRPGESDLDFLVSFEPRPAGSRPRALLPSRCRSPGPVRHGRGTL